MSYADLEDKIRELEGKPTTADRARHTREMGVSSSKLLTLMGFDPGGPDFTAVRLVERKIPRARSTSLVCVQLVRGARAWGLQWPSTR